MRTIKNILEKKNEKKKKTFHHLQRLVTHQNSSTHVHVNIAVTSSDSPHPSSVSKHSSISSMFCLSSADSFSICFIHFLLLRLLISRSFFSISRRFISSSIGLTFSSRCKPLKFMYRFAFRKTFLLKAFLCCDL